MGRFIPNENTFIGFTTEDPGAITGPTNTITPTSSAGSLAAVAHEYQITALTELGESAPGAAGTPHTNSANDSNSIAWTAVAGETMGYRIYGRVAGSIRLLGTVAHGVSVFVDDGSLTPDATHPVPTQNHSAVLGSPHAADVADSINLTHYVMSLNFGSTGNVVPTPALDKLFESSIIGTSSATATMDCYRDDELDLAWDTLPRKTKGYVFISRFGGEGANNMPIEDDIVEVWPVQVVSRTNANMANNTVSTFTVTFSVPDEPDEDAVVVA